jgi:Leucine-rich repeat (LRR) protein
VPAHAFADLPLLRREQALAAARNLRSLSLSHNALQTIDLPPGALPLLEELNVNKNELSSLTFVQVRVLF